MQQDNNIENKLRQLDDEQQPDLSSMDAHWQQMAVMLQPGAVTVKKAWPKWMMNTLSVVAVVVLTGAALWYLSIKKDGSDSSIAKQNSVIENGKVSTAAAAISSDTSKQDTLVETTPVSNVQYATEPASPANDLMDTAAGSVFDSLKINFTDCKTCPSKKVDSAVLTATRKMLLENLFAQLQKEEQKFIIDNSRDTLLQGKEGSVLLIPANSLGGYSGIKIIVKEFYKHSDIILNQLSTVSNKDQLVTGGMLQIKAMHNGSEVSMNQQKPIVLYMPDTSSSMQGMQLFDGENENDVINWVPQQGQYFTRKQLVTQVKVLNIIDQPFRVKERRRGQIGYFIIEEDSIKMDKEKLKQELKTRFGYYKVRLRSGIKDYFKYSNDDKEFNRDYATNIGDSVWIDKATADKYKLSGTATRQIEMRDVSAGFIPQTSGIMILDRNSSSLHLMGDTSPDQTRRTQETALAYQNLKNKYHVNLNQLGWINCDRFYSDSRQKIQYIVDLGDSAANYYNLLVFDKMNSMMSGAVYGTKVMFENIPLGEPVKIISIGINKEGETVYSLTSTTTSIQELTGLQFESISAPGLKTALSKMDK